MLKKMYLKGYLMLTIFVFCACSHQNQQIYLWDNNLSPEQNIVKNAIILGNNDDFSFLDKIVCNRSIFIFGEEGHAEDMSSITKLKMIEYLQKKGFNSIAFEGFPLLYSYMLSNQKYDNQTKGWRNVPFIYSTDVLIRETDVYQSFMKNMNERKIRIWGNDCNATRYDIVAVKIILREHSDIKNLLVDWDLLEYLYNIKFRQNEDRKTLFVSEQYELMRFINTISNYTQYIMSSKGNSMDLKVIMQWIRNVKMNFSNVEHLNTVENMLSDENIFISKLAETAIHNKTRDSQMAENTNWIIKNFPDEKLIVWTANFHAAKDITQTTYPTDSLLYFNMQCTGEFLAAEHGNKMFSLAFSSLNHPKDRESGELEKEIANASNNAPFAFVNFETLRFADGYRDSEFDSSVIKKKRGKWLHIFDGLYYIRDQQRKE
jgi:hypothetical protein